jgi:hypothetical protein
MAIQTKASEPTDFASITLRKGAPRGVKDFLGRDVGCRH